MVMYEAHHTSYLAHLGSTKMRENIKLKYLFPRMKREIMEYVAKY